MLLTTHTQIETAYRTMADRAGSSPADSEGALTDQDIADMVNAWAADEDGPLGSVIGYPDHRDRPAMIYAIEAARALCAGRRDTALTMLDLASASTFGSACALHV